MSVTVCIDTVDAQGAGVCTIGDEGGGLLGSSIASSGTNGPGYAYNDLALPADAGKEICGRITTWPASGTLYAYEDTSFTYTPSGDGATSFQYQLYVDYAPVGSPQTVTLSSGTGAATAAGATLSGISAIAAGTAVGGGSASASAPGAALDGASSISAGIAFGPTVTSVTVSPASAVLTGGGTLTLSAVVSGPGSPSQGVTWTTEAGSITSGGVVTAPAATTSTRTYRAIATSTADNTVSGYATITVPNIPNVGTSSNIIIARRRRRE